ncbi:nucleotide disphospho-sugar-binding domain-containing protein [uncultured Amnibacterium sp.]|uniref:nucleotide disphospho-sugar-binding domain-containing protein n=1 Tax=uncultured Amnibacterium sp. TaxID=1631851 RepID=UPI0035CA93E7
MSRVLFTSVRLDGFVLPLLQVVRAMVARGDDVWFLGGETHRAAIEGAGAVFVRLPYDAAVPTARLDRSRPRARVREVVDVLHGLFLDTIDEDHRAVVGLHRRLRLDLVVADTLSVGALALAFQPRADRPAVLAVGLGPLPVPDPAVPPFGMGLAPIDGPLNVVRNAALTAASDVLGVAGVRREFSAAVQRLTGRPLEGPLFGLPLVADRWAQASVPQFEYPRRTLPDRVRFIGPLPAWGRFPLPEWWDYRERRRIVHVTQGTYANEDPTDLIVPTIRALADEDVLVVATTGGPDAATVERAYGAPLPANARVERFMPYDHLLPAADVMVTNGGYGAVHHALRHGLPLVVAGTSEDRAEVNARVRWSGVGVDLHEQRPSPEAVGGAVARVLDERARFRRAAARLARAIAATDAVASVLAIADELMADRDAPAAAPA